MLTINKTWSFFPSCFSVALNAFSNIFEKTHRKTVHVCVCVCVCVSVCLFSIHFQDESVLTFVGNAEKNRSDQFVKTNETVLVKATCIYLFIC